MLDPSCDIRGKDRMRFGNDVVIQKDCWLNIAFNNPNSQYIIDIKEGTNIGRRCTISAANKIAIGKNVLIGPNVFIADTSHEYKHAGIPIINQTITTFNDEVNIGDETWIGTNTVIVGNVKIGKHCVIGANAVINKNIPDYCVVVGNPFKIVKMFDIETGKWVNIDEQNTVEKYLIKRENDLINYFFPITNLISLKIEVSSDLQLINDEIAEKIVTSGVRELSFLCDEINKETNEKTSINGKIEIFEKSFKLINKYKSKYNSIYPIVTPEIINRKSYCDLANDSIYIYSDGRVAPCCMDFLDKYFLGNINNSTIEEIWNSIPILKLRKELMTSPSETCLSCTEYKKWEIENKEMGIKL